MTTVTPRDRNYNPADAKIDETRVQVVAGYTRSLDKGIWQTTASVAHSRITDIRGFLRPGLVNDGSPNADSQRQRRSILDAYLDTHASAQMAPRLVVVYGADLMFGVGRQSSSNGEYFAGLDGSVMPPSTGFLHVDDPLVQNAGAERLKGAEAEFRAVAGHDLTLSAALSYHDARFKQYIATEGGASVDARGRQLPLSPRLLASLGAVYSPAMGVNASFVSNCVGRRYLDIANAAPTPRYLTADLALGYRWKASGVQLLVNNIANKRPPVSASEFGDQSYYLLPGRTVLVTYSLDL